VIFACDEAHMGAYVQVDREVPGRLIFIDQIGFYDTAIHLGGRDGPGLRLDLPTDAGATWQAGWLAVRPRSAWTVGGTTHAADTLLGIAFDRFLAGDRRFERLFEPGPRRALQGFFWCRGRLVTSVLDELRPVFTVFTPAERGWTGAEVPGLPRHGVAHLWPLDAEPEESDGALLAQVQDPITPATLLLTGTDLAAPAPLRRSSRSSTPPGWW
jgi:prolyl oligopeptidase